MTTEKLMFDASEPNRRIDENGYMHVKRSHLTKAQVRDYYGCEIAGWEGFGLEPTRKYFAYCPPEELQKPETIASLNGIPIQLNHHAESADQPALQTRVGSTGTDAVWNAPYLDNSLHFTVQSAIDHIEDGSMKQLSLSYRYRPDMRSGETPEGEKYDFVMRDIRANHVAIVEEGRAGPDVSVADSAAALKKEESMDEDKKDVQTAANDGDPAVENKEVQLATAVKKAADGIIDLHEKNASGDVVDKPTPAAGENTPPAPDDADKAKSDDEDKNAKITEILEAMKAKGFSDEELAAMKDKLSDLAYEPSEAGTDDAAGDNEGEGEEAAVCDAEALKACGLDGAPEEVQKAFAEGVKYGEKKEKEEPKKLDSLHESEGEKKALAEDSAAYKKIEEKIMQRMKARFDAAEEVRGSLGSVRFDAYDSADSIYLDALKQEGLAITGIEPGQARIAYLAFIAGRAKRGGAMANDAAPKNQGDQSPIAAKLSKIICEG